MSTASSSPSFGPPSCPTTTTDDPVLFPPLASLPLSLPCPTGPALLLLLPLPLLLGLLLLLSPLLALVLPPLSDVDEGTAALAACGAGG